jgi:DNA-binding transcriptional LysR family regulator
VNLHQLRCFLAVADELHFGRAARRLEILPSALSRDIRLLETSLGTRLLVRTTRNVMLSQDGAAFVDDARALVTRADGLAAEMRGRGRRQSRSLIRIGAIDTAAAGLIPSLLRDLRELHASAVVQLVEDKTIRLVPKLLSGRLDIAFIRPPEQLDKRIELMMLFHETPVVAVPTRHRLASRRRLSIEALAGEPMIVPDRSSRPHSHDLTIKLFERAGLRPNLSQIAEEKQTIVHLVAAGLGLAIVPKGASRLGVTGVRFVPLASRETAGLDLLPMAAAWLRNSRDPLRDELLGLLRLPRYAAGA